MTQFLPPNLLALFEPRPALSFLPPPTPLLVEKNAKLPESRYEGVAAYLHLFEHPSETPAKTVVETKEEKKERKRREKEELLAYKVEQGIAQWNPAENSKATEDPYKTLFVSRINYETSESKLKRELEQYGKIKRINMVHDSNGKPRGYAFVEYSSKDDMHNAYKRADGQKIDGRRISVDYERGRTQKTWLPRRLGGGKGDTRRARESRKNIEEKDGAAANGNENFRERGDRGDRRDKGGDRGDRDRGGRNRRSRSRDNRGDGNRGDGNRGDGNRGDGNRGDGRRDYRDGERGGGRGGYRGGPPTVASYAGGGGGSYGGRDNHRNGGYGGHGGHGRDNYGNGGGRY